MGMYDNVKFIGIETLPEFTHGNINDVEWQTKGIEEPTLSTFIIKNNRLIKINHEWEEVPLGERVNVGGYNVPLIRPKRTWEVDMDYHGKFTFYTVIQEPGEDGLDVWYEYEAKFTDGDLVSINILSKRGEFVNRNIFVK